MGHVITDKNRPIAFIAILVFVLLLIFKPEWVICLDKCPDKFQTEYVEPLRLKALITKKYIKRYESSRTSRALILLNGDTTIEMLSFGGNLDLLYERAQENDSIVKEKDSVEYILVKSSTGERQSYNYYCIVEDFPYNFTFGPCE